MSLKGARVERLHFAINQVDLLAGTPFELIAPFDGYLTTLRTSMQVTATTGGTIVAKTGDALAVTVAGLSNDHTTNKTKGDRKTSVATPKSTTKKVLAGDRIAIVPASFATAGAVNGYISIHDANEDPAL